jgi:Cof subfamily protein (haloacid dehalogenase superfamily)
MAEKSVTTSPSFKNIRALAFDLDGTLLMPGGVLSERSLAAVKECMARGIKVIIATGRAREAAEKYRLAINVEGPMVYFNGALVADMPSKKVLSTCLLDAVSVEAGLAVAREGGFYFQVFFPPLPGETEPLLLAEADREELAEYGDHTGIYAKVGDIKEELSKRGGRGVIKAMFIADPEVIDASIRPRLDERFGRSIYIARTRPRFIEMLSGSVSKGVGLGIALGALGLSLEETIAFGDEENDIPMLKAAGWSVAPSNAKAEAKEAAREICRPNTEDGVALWLENFLARRD